MTAHAGTFAYLIVRTLRNRLVTMARRLRRPKYALGFVIITAYFGVLLYGSTRGGSGGINMFANTTVEQIAPLMLLLILASSWLVGGAQSALAFTQAEVSLLFPAPVSRRQLIIYKIAGAQPPIVLNAFIFAFLFGNGPQAIPRWLAVVSLWVMFSTLGLHRLGAALVRSATVEHGASGARRTWLSQAVGIVILAVIGVAFVAEGPGRSPDSSIAGIIARVTAVTSLPAVQVVLFPFSLIVAPTFAKSLGAWAVAMGPAVGVLLFHAVWVLRTQVAFEEAAAEASAKHHALLESVRKKGIHAAHDTAPKAKRTLALPPRGHPAVAILWKNALNLIRTWRPTQFIGAMIMPGVIAAMLSVKSGDPAASVAIAAAMVAFMLFMTGGMSVRNDLRADLLNLSVLKTLPLRGREIVLAEVASSALPLAAMQTLLLAIAAGALQLSAHPMPGSVALAVVVTMPIALVALNLCMATLQNGVAVTFPGWVQLGGAGQGVGGMEVMGQAMLGMLALFVSFLLCMIAPAAVAFIVFSMVQPPAVVAAPFVIVVGALAVAGESYAIMLWLGRALERLEPSQVG